jgi:ribosomal protein S18 acetylase RimI-like enzyme
MCAGSSSTPSIHVRGAQPGDLDAMHAIRRDAILGIQSGLEPCVREAWAGGRTAAFYANRVAAGDAVMASLPGDDVGWASSAGDRITALYVRSSCGHRGVGRALMSTLEAAIEARGLGYARLESSANAVGFYIKLGYAPTGVPLLDGALPMARRLRLLE